MDKIVKCCTCIIVNNATGKILLEKRNSNRKLDPGAIDFCSGHVEDKEIFYIAMRRELEEELGIDRYEKIEMYDVNTIELDYSKDKKMQVKVYCMFTDLEEEDFVLQQEEVEKVSYQEPKVVYNLVKNKKTRFPNDERILEILRNVNEMIKNRVIVKNENIR